MCESTCFGRTMLCHGPYIKELMLLYTITNYHHNTSSEIFFLLSLRKVFHERINIKEKIVLSGSYNYLVNIFLIWGYHIKDCCKSPWLYPQGASFGIANCAPSWLHHVALLRHWCWQHYHSSLHQNHQMVSEYAK